MYCLCLAGLLGMTITGDAFNLFVFLEIASLSTYVLIALGRDRRALLAAFQYLILGTIGATFFVIGVGLLYLKTGTLNIADMAERLPGYSSERSVLAALAFITVGMSLKLALFPLHLWLPNAYTFAPSAVTAFLAATATKVSVYVLLRFYFDVFGLQLVTEVLPMREILMGLSILAIVSASLVAVLQTDLKRLFAYSSVAQIGYITLGVSLASVDGLTAAIVHLFNHGITKGALFLLLGIVAYHAGRTPLDGCAGARAHDAAHRDGHRARGAVADRRAGNGRLRQQVVPGARRARGRTLVAGGARRRQLADRGGLRLALRRGGLPERAVADDARARATRRVRCSCRPGCWSRPASGSVSTRPSPSSARAVRRRCWSAPGDERRATASRRRCCCRCSARSASRSPGAGRTCARA